MGPGTRSRKLTPATPDDLQNALAFALKFNGKKRYHQADGHMASIVAKHLIDHLERCGFVVMKKPPARLHST
jgi:hypothetical protein